MRVASFSAAVPALLVVTLLAGCGGAMGGASTSASTVATVGPASAPSSASRAGEVERTTFADALGVVLGAMTRLPSGVYYRDIEEGAGIPAMTGREVLVSYVAFIANGTEVDRTAPGTRPIVFTMGDGVVIRGWDLGIRGMRKGGTRQLVVPSRYAYGSRTVGLIPANAVMVFLVRLDGVR